VDPPGAAIGIAPAAGVADIEAARELFREYQRAIGVDLCFQGFEQELAALPGVYAPPSGRLLLARAGGALAGCVALRGLSDDTGEMKRLYVRPLFQGRGLGRDLVTALFAEARAADYSVLRLDTLPSMKAAAALYTSLGFAPIPSYNSSSLDGMLFFELRL
jgi:putative acetyltransferase